ncbi:aldehyde dehydrogenase [Bradyrhizobium sp. WSM3983]|uniref:aldehyde dehydrogenase n=1 Tax=Bradyrhizobium sp. WSM3983 TaxID=1038867 RepID=UPI0004152AB3|nr:aldehyde dehydrogenase [Bradyrhizobium sp. WSM3983]
MEEFLMRIGDRWQAATSNEWIESENPYTGKPWARVPRGTSRDAEAAVLAAHEAFTEGPWSRMSPADRGLLLYKLADCMAADAEHLAELEVRDTGKLKAEMLGNLRYLPRWYQYYGGLADKIEGSVTPIDKPGMFHYVAYEPLGVVTCIVPWNSPLLLTTMKVAAALAAGNTVVIKPSEFASTSVIEFARLFEKAGFPPGVVNVVTGYGAEVGEVLTTHPLVRRVAFTGGDVGGKAVATAAAKTFKRISLELGGKSPNIVFADANLDAAVKGVISGVFAATGQTCMAGSRLLVHSSIHDRFVDKLVAFVSAAKLGDPSRPETNMGPVSTRPQLERVMKYIEIARSEGAKCATGGRRGSGEACGDGWFVEPTIFTGVKNSMRIAREEIFGPVLTVIPFDSDDEAVEIANDTPYGLAAAIWTTSLERVVKMPKRLHSGTVWVNAYRVVSYLAPFGGVKGSGIGRENGIEAIKEYLETKSVFINGNPDVPNPFVMG